MDRIHKIIKSSLMKKEQQPKGEERNYSISKTKSEKSIMNYLKKMQVTLNRRNISLVLKMFILDNLIKLMKSRKVRN